MKQQFLISFFICLLFLNCQGKQTDGTGEAVKAENQNAGIELYPIADAYICDCLPDVTNPNGGKYALFQGQYGSCYDRTLMRWDLSELEKDLKIRKAELVLNWGTFHGVRSGKMAFFPIKKKWDAATVTINTRPPYDTGLKVTADWPEGNLGGLLKVDITPIFMKWYNHEIENNGLYCHSENTKGPCDLEYTSVDNAEKILWPRIVVTVN
jgi:hypothetical protein